MEKTYKESHLHHRVRFVVLLGGITVFVFFGATIVFSYLTTLQGQRERILEGEFPRLVRASNDQVLAFFDPLTRSLDLLVSHGGWEEILDQAVEDPEHFRRQAERWANSLEVTDIALADIRRELVYAYWSGEPIQLDPALERDMWFYETWTGPSPPEKNIAFYYDETVGGRAFFYDYLLRDSRGRPLGILGALVELEKLALQVQRELSSGEFVYLVDAEDQILLEISEDTVQEFFPVYTTTGIEIQNPCYDSLQSLLISESYLEAALELEQPVITSDGEYAVGVFSLPGLDITAHIFLSTRERLEHSRGILLRHMLALLITFILVIGGYLGVIGFYANRGTNQLLLIQRNRAQLDEVVSVLAHGLGNDLQILRGSVSRQSMQIQKELDPLVFDMEQVLQNAIYSVQLADDFAPVFLQPLDVAALRERLISSCTVALHAKGQTFLSAAGVTPGGTSGEILTDEDLVYHVLLNLLSNAMKYSPAHTTILFAARLTEEALEFLVADQGPGFSEEDRRRLFRKFSRLSARPTQGERSTGVGLFVSSRLTRRLGGKLILLETLPSWSPALPGRVGAVWLVSLPRAGVTSRAGVASRTRVASRAGQ